MRKILVPLAVVVLATVGCAGDSTAPEATEAMPEISHLQFTVTGGDGSWKIYGPANDVPAGVYQIDVKNEAKDQVEFELVRFDEADKLAEAIAFFKDTEGTPIPAFLHPYGMPSGELTPGVQRSFTTVLDAGSYYALDQHRVSDESSPMHAEKGGQVGFTVTGTSTEQLPKTDVTIEAREYEFVIPAIKAGSRSITFKNTGKQIHHGVPFKLKPGKTAADLKAALESEGGGGEASGPPPPFEDPTGDLAVIDSGRAYSTNLELTAGAYVLVCFINDRAGGPPHFTKGMLTPFKVS